MEEACNYLGVCRRSISRYIKSGQLNPNIVLSACGTNEYRFDLDDLDSLADGKSIKVYQAEQRLYARRNLCICGNYTRYDNKVLLGEMLQFIEAQLRYNKLI